MKLNCPNCSTSLNLPDRFAGKTAKCPACQHDILCPELPAAPVAEPGFFEGLMKRLNFKKAAASASASAQQTSAVEEPMPAAAAVATDGDELSLQKLETASGHAPPDPSSITHCPSCGKEWKKGAIQCKCRYNLITQKKMREPRKERIKLNIDAQKLFLYAFVGCCLFFGYWMYNGGFNWLSRTISDGFDEASGSGLQHKKKP